MSFKTSLVKFAIKLTPDILVKWVANIVLKDIAEISDFIFDLDSRIVYVEITLLGEVEPIEVALNDFSIVSDEESYQLIIQKAKSNKLWMNNILSRIVGKPWAIPATPEYKTQLDLVADLLKADSPQQETT